MVIIIITVIVAVYYGCLIPLRKSWGDYRYKVKLPEEIFMKIGIFFSTTQIIPYRQVISLLTGKNVGQKY